MLATADNHDEVQELLDTLAYGPQPAPAPALLVVFAYNDTVTLGLTPRELSDGGTAELEPAEGPELATRFHYGDWRDELSGWARACTPATERAFQTLYKPSIRNAVRSEPDEVVRFLAAAFAGSHTLNVADRPAPLTPDTLPAFLTEARQFAHEPPAGREAFYTATECSSSMPVRDLLAAVHAATT